ncbi:Rpn family recombination-promoting nuclease/putative transposase [Archangium sp.]|uniref:Rpn family recombination-promoting nuclease/putative transposase n=1 Tax=Archangium sp. TaxID=1872627 RepID=UPI002EDAE3B1
MSGPHDLFARYTFGHPERAAAELRAVLPAHVVSEVDWASLRREPGSVVDAELRETESDLLFTARLRTGHPLLLYVLLEHQSSVERWMALRMLRYVVRQLERWRQEHPESGLGGALHAGADRPRGWRAPGGGRPLPVDGGRRGRP